MRIRNVYVHVTKACNLRCRYCYYSASKPLPDELSTAELAGLWHDLALIVPEKVIITGGEPMLRPDLLQLLKALNDRVTNTPTMVCLNSNGHFFTEESVWNLRPLVSEFRLSVDALEAANDKLRGDGNFSAVMRAIHVLRRAGITPRMLVTVSDYGASNLPELIKLLTGLGITKISLNAVRAVGRASGREWMTSDQVEAIGGLEPEVISKHNQTNCGVGSFINVMSNGDVFPCHVLTYTEFKCGNLRNERLTEMCLPNQILHSFSRLNFHAMANEHSDFRDLTKRGVCLDDLCRTGAGRNRLFQIMCLRPTDPC